MHVTFVEPKSYFSKTSLQGEILSEEESCDDLDLPINTPTPFPNIEPNDTPTLLLNIESDSIVPPVEHDKNLETGGDSSRIHELIVYSRKNGAQSRDKHETQQGLESNQSPSSESRGGTCMVNINGSATSRRLRFFLSPTPFCSGVSRQELQWFGLRF